MDIFSSLLEGLGLAVAAGLNAWIPLLLLGLGARFLPDGWVELSPSLQFLATDWCLILLGVLLTVEVLADKIPVVDHVNDVIHTLIRPAAGALLFIAATGAIALDPRVAGVLGFLAAGAVHGFKMAARPVVTAATGGTGNPVVSFVEDVVSFFTALAALLMPLLVLAIVVGGPILLYRTLVRLRRKKSRAAERPIGTAT
jgi:hypothetical protein